MFVVIVFILPFSWWWRPLEVRTIEEILLLTKLVLPRVCVYSKAGMRLKRQNKARVRRERLKLKTQCSTSAQAAQWLHTKQERIICLRKTWTAWMNHSTWHFIKWNNANTVPSRAFCNFVNKAAIVFFRKIRFCVENKNVLERICGLFILYTRTPSFNARLLKKILLLFLLLKHQINSHLLSS